MLWRALEKSGYYLVGTYVFSEILGRVYLIWMGATWPYKLQNMGMTSYSGMNWPLYFYSLFMGALLLFLWTYTGKLFMGKRTSTPRFVVGVPILWWIFEMSIGNRIFYSLLRKEEMEGYELVSAFVDEYVEEHWGYTSSFITWSFTLLQVTCIIYLVFSRRAKKIFVR